MTVRSERSFERDMALSLRHRTWGYDLPCTDIDFLLVEYDRAKPKALIEYKREGATIDYQNSTNGMNQKSYQALIELANRAGIPFFVVKYSADTWMFEVFPWNPLACRWVSVERKFTEQDYINFLFEIRRSKIGGETMVELKTYKCDRCGEVFQTDPVKNPPIGLADISGQIPFGLDHLCEKCYHEFFNWFQREPLDKPWEVAP